MFNCSCINKLGCWLTGLEGEAVVLVAQSYGCCSLYGTSEQDLSVCPSVHPSVRPSLSVILNAFAQFSGY